MTREEELVGRWDAFLKKMEVRFNESLVYAEDACIEQLKTTDYEYETVMRAWQGMKAQIRELITKIDDTWTQKVAPEMEREGDFWSNEMGKGSNLGDRLEDELSSFERALEGKLSLSFYEHAVLLAEKKHQCTQCNGTIAIRKDVFRSQYISCTYCQAVNTIEPETKFLKIGWGVVDNIAKIRAQKEYDEMQNASEELRLQRKPVAVSYWEQYERTYFVYWERFFKERMNLNSEAEKRYEADMQRKRQEFDNYKKIQTS